MTASRTTILASLLATALVVPLAGCSDGLPRLSDLNPFKEKQIPLPGKRIPVVLSDTKTGSIELASAERPMTLPPPRVNDGWEEPGGSPTNSPGHLQLSANPRIVWSADVGQGSSKYGRMTASPIVAYGKVFTLDSSARVSALTLSGATAWRFSLAPEGSKAYKAFGGGLAADGGRIFVATGQGIVMALEPQGGKKLWEKILPSPIRSAPTAANGHVFVLTTEGRAYSLAAADGHEEWSYRGLPEQATLLLGASPAVDGEMVVFPYPNGELVALKIADGSSVWSESLARTRTASSLGAMSDAARPAIDGGVLFGIGHAGRMVATSVKTGERLWSLSLPGIQMPYVVGEIVYLVDTGGQLIALNRRDGKAIWTTKLAGAKSWSGPVLAGGRLWLVSDRGQLIGANAMSGKVESQLSLGANVFIAPVVASGRMFILTDTARLIALN